MRCEVLTGAGHGFSLSISVGLDRCARVLGEGLRS